MLDLAAPRIEATSPDAPRVVPRQLLAPATTFAGRAAELAELTSLMATESADQPTIVAISAGGGMGKTWLAREWAVRHASGYPDGQLYVDLHGFDPVSEPTTAAAASGGSERAGRDRPTSRLRSTPRLPCTGPCSPIAGCWSSSTMRRTPAPWLHCCPGAPGSRSRSRVAGGRRAWGSHGLAHTDPRRDLAAQAREVWRSPRPRTRGRRGGSVPRSWNGSAAVASASPKHEPRSLLSAAALADYVAELRAAATRLDAWTRASSRSACAPFWRARSGPSRATPPGLPPHGSGSGAGPRPDRRLQSHGPTGSLVVAPAGRARGGPPGTPEQPGAVRDARPGPAPGRRARSGRPGNDRFGAAAARPPPAHLPGGVAPSLGPPGRGASPCAVGRGAGRCRSAIPSRRWLGSSERTGAGRPTSARW